MSCDMMRPLLPTTILLTSLHWRSQKFGLVGGWTKHKSTEFFTRKNFKHNIELVWGGHGPRVPPWLRQCLAIDSVSAL